MVSNKHKPDFIDRTLIRLKREYGKDELVATLNRQIAEKDVEIGQLKAEVDHLQFQLGKPVVIADSDSVEEINSQARIECRKDELYKGVLRQNKELRNRLKKLNNDYDNLMAKYCAVTKKEESLAVADEASKFISVQFKNGVTIITPKDNL